MFYVEIERFKTAQRKSHHYIGSTYMKFNTLNEARKYAITIINRGEWGRTTAYISQAFFPNKDVMSFIGGGVRGVNIKKDESGDPYGAVVPYRGKYYWVLNNPEHKKYVLNMYGDTIDLPSKGEWHPFGL